MVELDIPTPSPLPTPSNSPYSLSERINISTRPIHSQLNRLILARLPLALPPYTTNPSTYISGLLHIAPIYITFESLWQTILDAPRLPTTLKPSFEFGIDACDPEQPFIDSKSPVILPHTDIPVLAHAPKVCSRTHSLLAHLRLPGLLRAGRLRADIRVLTGTPEHKIDEQLDAVSQNGRLAEFIAHTKQSVETNPHVLLAYAWVLYMALFSGGRYLRASLQQAGGSAGDFWNREPSPVRPYPITQRRDSRSEICCSDSSPSRGRSSSRSHTKNRSESSISNMVPGLQFFNFLGDEDGEDIKLEFKKRITEAEILLTPREKEDIIDEAEEIFKFMVEMVGELDEVMGTNEDDIETARLAQKHPNLMTSRDSVAVAQERLLKKTRTMSTTLEEKLEEHKRKPSYVEVFVTGPVTKLVHFADDIPTLSWVRKRLCGFSHDGECNKPADVKIMKVERQEAHVVRFSTLVLVLAFLVMFLAWYYST